eukprot:GCRY01000500.1.p1 GENE.GCRY01000500.1~~GCRY01000500.1.p1  ORF type:complete len:722 (+),score=284.47 GCRY01000500.1:158-2323(+)
MDKKAKGTPAKTTASPKTPRKTPAKTPTKSKLSSTPSKSKLSTPSKATDTPKKKKTTKSGKTDLELQKLREQLNAEKELSLKIQSQLTIKEKEFLHEAKEKEEKLQELSYNHTRLGEDKVDLEKLVEDLREHLTQQRAEWELTEKQKNELKLQNEEQARKVEFLQTELDQVTSSVADLQEKLKTEEGKNSFQETEFKSQLSEVNHKLLSAQTQNAVLEDKISSLERTLEKEKEMREKSENLLGESVEAQSAHFNSIHTTLRKELEEKQAEIDRLSQQRLELEAANTELKTANQRLELKIQELDSLAGKKNNYFQETLAFFRGEIEKHVAKKHSLEESLALVDAERFKAVTEQERLVRTQDSELNKVQQVSAETQAALTARVDQLQRQHEQLTGELGTSKDHLRKMQEYFERTMDFFKENQSKLVKQQHALTQDKADLELGYKQAADERERLALKVTALEEKIESLKAEIAGKDEEREKLVTELQLYRDQEGENGAVLAGTRSDLERLQENLTFTKTRHKEHQQLTEAQIDELRARLRESEETVKTLELEKDQLLHILHGDPSGSSSGRGRASGGRSGDALMSQMHSLEVERESLRTTLDTRDRAHKDEAAKLEERIEALTQTLREAKKAHLKEKKELTTQLDCVQQEVVVLEAEHERLTQQLRRRPALELEEAASPKRSPVKTGAKKPQTFASPTASAPDTPAALAETGEAGGADAMAVAH